MSSKKAALVINPRTGENVAKITDVLAVLAAAGWKTDVALKEYSGHTLELANKASENNSDLVIAYGGDGTLNQVVNGVMNVKKQHSIVGVIPGGTANVWAGEVGIPTDPIQAVLSLVNSEPRKVDVGHVAVQSLTYPDGTSETIQVAPANGKGSKKRKQASPENSKGKHHFLLMAGLGIDAAIMQHVSKPLKYRIGPLAVGFSAAKELPQQHAFPIEVRSTEKGRAGELLWQGEALQVVIGNTRRYANLTEMTPDAYIDDGILDVCVITGGDPLSTMQQISSLLLRRKPDNLNAEYFHGAHLSITVPASVAMQLDGSAVKLKDYLKKSQYSVLQQPGEMEHIMVTYCFDAMPHALEVAIPRTYNDELFEHTNGQDKTHDDIERERERVKTTVHSHTHHHSDEGIPQTALQEHTATQEVQPKHKQDTKQPEDGKKEMPASVHTLLEKGRKVTVVGKTPLADKVSTYIIAGGTQKASSGETCPVAVVVTGKTTLFNHRGDELPIASIDELREGMVIVVAGKKSRRSVIDATTLVL